MEDQQSSQSEVKQENVKKEFKSFAISLKDFFFEQSNLIKNPEAITFELITDKSLGS